LFSHFRHAKFLNHTHKKSTKKRSPKKVLSLIQVTFNSPTQPAIGLSLLCLILDISKQLYNEECAGSPSSSLDSPYLIVNHRYFYDGSFNYTNVDRIGGVISHLNKVHRRDLSEALGDEFVQRPQETSGLFRDICE
jgi:hypothetical protein